MSCVRELNTPETPLDDEHEALRILCDRSHRHGAYLCLNANRSASLRRLYRAPRLVVQHLGGYGDMEVRDEEVTYVTSRVVSVLHDLTRGTAHWGYTDEHERQLSERGQEYYNYAGSRVGDGVEALIHWLYGASPRSEA